MTEPLTPAEWEALEESIEMAKEIDIDDLLLMTGSGAAGWAVQALRDDVPKLLLAYTELERLAADMMAAWEQEKVQSARRIVPASAADMRQALATHPMAMKRRGERS